VNYNVAEEQFAKLLEVSSTCSQSVTLNCFSSPIKLLQWKDRFGDYHAVPNLNGTTCDSKDPTWLVNSGIVEDKTLLPISGVRFGPHKYEIQKAKITIGPLQCQQDDNEPFDIEKEIKTLQIDVTKRALKTELETTKLSLQNDINSKASKVDLQNLKNEVDVYRLKCAAEETNYRMVNGKCVYYETSHYNYEDAKQKCEARFNNNGRLYEPKTWSENEHAQKVGRAVKDRNWKIGINDKQTEGQFVYESDGTPISYIPKWYADYKAKGTSNNCIIFATGSTTLWLDYGCSYSDGSICEQNT